MTTDTQAITMSGATSIEMNATARSGVQAASHRAATRPTATQAVTGPVRGFMMGSSLAT